MGNLDPDSRSFDDNLDKTIDRLSDTLSDLANSDLDNEALEKLMGTKVMGWEYRDEDHVKREPAGFFIDGEYRIGIREWRPRINMNQALMCAEEFKTKFGARWWRLESTPTGEFSMFIKMYTGVGYNDEDDPSQGKAFLFDDESAPIAICKAIAEALDGQ